MKRVMVNSIFKETNLYYGQHTILELLNKKNGSSQIEIAEELGVTAASIAMSTKRMEKNGLLYKQVDENNLRCKKIFVTEKGVKSLKRVHKEINKINEYMFKGFTEEETIAFDRYLENIMKNILDYKVLDLKVENIMKALNLNTEENDV